MNFAFIKHNCHEPLFSAPLLVSSAGYSLLFLLALLPLSVVKSVEITSYSIGNSLTWDSQPLGVAAIANDFGFDQTVGHHIRCSWSLNGILEAPDNTCLAPVPEFGRFGEALPNYPWDAVTLQPHRNATFNSTLLSDVDAVLGFISESQSNGLNADTTFYLYTGWPVKQNYSTAWTAPVVDADTTPTVQAREYIEHLVDRVRSATSTKVNVIPIGEVLYELDQRMQAGQIPGFNDIGDFYRDNIHLTLDLGRYAAGITTFATMYGIDPAGSTKPDGFYGNGTAFTPALYDAIQDAVWDVISGDPYAGSIFTPGDFDRDKDVDGADFDVFQASFSLGSGGDADRDGDTDGADFLSWQRNYTGNALPFIAPVPEPSSLVLLMAGTILIRREFLG